MSPGISIESKFAYSLYLSTITTNKNKKATFPQRERKYLVGHKQPLTIQKQFLTQFPPFAVINKVTVIQKKTVIQVIYNFSSKKHFITRSTKCKLSPHLYLPIFPLLPRATVYRPLCMTGGFCPGIATCSRPFQAGSLPYTPPSAPVASHLLVSFRSQGLSYACCPTQSRP